MDDILEAVFEIILEGSFELVANRKVPMAIRVLVSCVLGALYVGFAGFILVIVWAFWGKGDIPGMVATAVGGTGLLAVLGYLAWKEYKEVKNRVD